MNTEKPIIQSVNQPNQPVNEENEIKSVEVESTKPIQGGVYTYNICEGSDSDSDFWDSSYDSEDLENILGQGCDHLWDDDY